MWIIHFLTGFTTSLATIYGLMLYKSSKVRRVWGNAFGVDRVNLNERNYQNMQLSYINSNINSNINSRVTVSMSIRGDIEEGQTYIHINGEKCYISAIIEREDENEVIYQLIGSGGIGESMITSSISIFLSRYRRANLIYTNRTNINQLARISSMSSYYVNYMLLTNEGVSVAPNILPISSFFTRFEYNRCE